MFQNSLIIILLILFSNASISQQETWTIEEEKILIEFGLSKLDNRGIILTKSQYCDKKFGQSTEAIIDFFTPTIRKDLYAVCIEDEIDEQYLDNPLNLKQIIDLYIILQRN